MPHDLQVNQPASNGTRTSRGGPYDGGDGYRADDPPTQAQYECASCGWAGEAGDCASGTWCPGCEEREYET